MILRPKSQSIGPSADQLLAIVSGLAGDLLRGFRNIDPAISIVTSVSCLSLVTQGTANIAWLNDRVTRVGVGGGVVIGASGLGKTFAATLLAESVNNAIAQRISTSKNWAKTPMFFVEDATREALIMHLIEWSVAALFSDEAGQLQRLFSTAAATMAKLVDGTPLYHSRISTGRASLQNHRLTVLAMMQPEIFENMKKLMGFGRGSIGLINRFIIGQATSSPNHTAMTSMGLPSLLLARYATRVDELVNLAIDIVLSNSERPTLRLSSAAQRRFINIAGEMTSLRHDPNAGNLIEYASRHSERVLQIAGSLHVFNDQAEGEVQLESVEAAHQLDLWSIDNFAALSSIEAKPTQLDIDTMQLGDALLNAARFRGPELALQPLRRTAMNIGLTRARFDRALTALASTGRITMCIRGREDVIFVHGGGAPWLDFNKRG